MRILQWKMKILRLKNDDFAGLGLFGTDNAANCDTVQHDIDTFTCPTGP